MEQLFATSQYVTRQWTVCPTGMLAFYQEKPVCVQPVMPFKAIGEPY